MRNRMRLDAWVFAGGLAAFALALALWSVPLMHAALALAFSAVVGKLSYRDGYRAAEDARVRRKLAERMASDDLVD